ncbi:MAG: bifunctional tetrahydrofolate synthase/dihydrofolate synthase [Woeseiaceae bacterium]
MRFSSLPEWLTWQEGLHPSTIELGLERVSKVFKRLHPTLPSIPVITVAGTNGKGSSVALLESIYQNAGYRSGTYTSPHLLRYNERIHINGEEVSDEKICEAFARIDKARLENNEEISLTYFEFGTLAALDLFYHTEPDVIILEVGLGGRLDVVNIVDADVALITSISIDHTNWLGNDRETIAIEKAGIMRANHPVVYSSPDMPQSIAETAKSKGAVLFQRGKDFDWKKGMGSASWEWKSNKQQRTALPHSNLRGRHQLDNAAGVLMAIELLAGKLSVNQKQIKDGLLSVSVAGRFQCEPGTPMHILDVAHNQGSMACLAESLKLQACDGNNIAVLGMLNDKAHTDALAEMMPEISKWYVADLDVPRGATSEKLASVLKGLDESSDVSCFTSVEQAIKAADEAAENNDRVIIFGSFYTVELGLILVT